MITVIKRIEDERANDFPRLLMDRYRWPEKCFPLEPTVDPTASVRDCRLGAYTEVGARTILLEVDDGRLFLRRERPRRSPTRRLENSARSRR